MLMLALTYNRSLPNIVTHKNWDIFSINKSFKEIFKKKTVTAFTRNKNLKGLIDCNKIEYNKMKKTYQHNEKR